MGFDSKCDFTPSTVLLGLPLCHWTWGICFWLFGFPHPEYGHVPMLLAPDGRRLSKRDRDLDLGVLRQRIRPEQLIGTLAFASGLIDRNVPISSKELAAEFRWDRLKGDSIYLNAEQLI